jgi:hypothetical protein
MPTLETDTLASGLKQIAQKRISFVSVLRRYQIGKLQNAHFGEPGIASLERRIHFRNYSLLAATCNSHGSMFENGTEGGSRALTREEWQ